MRFVVAPPGLIPFVQHALTELNARDVRRLALNDPRRFDELRQAPSGSEVCFYQVFERDQASLRSVAVNCSFVEMQHSDDYERLRLWVVGKFELTELRVRSQGFAELGATFPNLIIADSALDRVAKVDGEWNWVISDSARALAEFSRDAARAGPPSHFLRKHAPKLRFADDDPKILFRYSGDCGKEKVQGESRWHLKPKRGLFDVPPERVPRVYFHNVRITESRVIVLILYVGPHPSNGNQTVVFHLEE